ncbi:hypothetical protein PHLGIDRAFT_119821 [Phlebiopsis gigantea 11061_1 CR5-6]|uniref:Carbohydrate-binding module family 13 protein n=1 Tax=Phlebiopsis gigantea (strain 11061_1 CR5-6) TaxID=745531 RepID=A0A0C3S578_PHLG1|nr:hypothetical protein PHLGIDRAFT_119821 [Phlebiopsis gigantea 11061_1 CR5-6]
MLEEQQGTRTKWQISGIGKGYVVKHVQSGLYCSLSEGRTFLDAPVTLSSMPTVWDISYLDEQMKTVRIFWSISQLCWDATVPVWDEEVQPRLSEIEHGQRTSSTWQLLCHRTKSYRSDWQPNRIPQGVYALQNKASLTYVSLSPDERTLGCWPPGTSHLRETKIWEIAPFGAGYTIKLRDTDKCCTLKEGISNGCTISVSSIPAAWRIKVLESPLDTTGIYIQILWADTEMSWDLSGNGKSTPGNPICMKKNKGYHDCRVFKLVE